MVWDLTFEDTWKAGRVTGSGRLTNGSKNGHTGALGVWGLGFGSRKIATRTGTGQTPRVPCTERDAMVLYSLLVLLFPPSPALSGLVMRSYGRSRFYTPGALPPVSKPRAQRHAPPTGRGDHSRRAGSPLLLLNEATAPLGKVNHVWFRGGLAFEARRLLYHSAYGSRTF